MAVIILNYLFIPPEKRALYKTKEKYLKLNIRSCWFSSLSNIFKEYDNKNTVIFKNMAIKYSNN